MAFIGARRALIRSKRFTTLDPANKGAAIVLSGGNLTASNSNASNTDASVKSTTSYLSGKFYAEVTAVADSRGLIGIGNASASLSNYVGSDANGIGVFDTNGDVFVNAAVVATVQAFTTGSIVSVALDIGNSQIWFRVGAGNWNNSGAANPATNAGGIAVTGNGVGAAPYFFMVSPANTSTTYTVNFGATAYAETVPAGFGNW